MRLARLALWRALALASVGLGVIGIVVPGLPSVPFFLLAAWAAGRGWPSFEAWLLAHPKHGPSIRQWRESGAVPRRAKWAASAMMLLSTAVLQIAAVPSWLSFGAPVVMLAVAVWLWRRPEPLQQA